MTDFTGTFSSLPESVRMMIGALHEEKREIGARVTLLMHEAHKAGRRTVTLRELLEAVGEPHHRLLWEQMLWLEMEWHDDWSFLEATEDADED